MAKLDEADRDRIPASEYGLPKQKKYPMPDKTHARNAKARASQQEHAGHITASQKATIDRKADKIIDK